MTDDEPGPAELLNYAVCPACGYAFGDETLDDATTEVLDEEDGADGVGQNRHVFLEDAQRALVSVSSRPILFISGLAFMSSLQKTRSGAPTHGHFLPNERY